MIEKTKPAGSASTNSFIHWSEQMDFLFALIAAKVIDQLIKLIKCRK